ncbi:hypothetical protein [Roseovarius sp. 2305UL8-3]|uniref:hypothetical protein n=1 Tax=Roseovarius conchicola TaxID=3121636 RepID=UPI003529803A
MATHDKFPGADAVTDELKLDGIVKGDISKAGETDWIKVHLVKGQGYKLVVTGKNSRMGTLEDPTLQVFGADGKPTKGIFFNDFITNSNRIRRSDEFRGFVFSGETGDYYLKVGSRDAAKTGSYSAHIRHVVEGADEYTTVGTLDPKTGLYPVPKDLTPLKDGASIKGSLNRILGTEDSDSFKVNLVKGRTYTFDASPDGSKGLPLTTGVSLELFSQDGKLVKDVPAAPTGWDSKLTFTAKESGSYALRVNGGIYPTGEYKVSMSSVGPAPKDDAAGDATTKRSAKLGEVLSGNIETSGDQDWVKVRLEKGKQYQLLAAGAASGNGTLNDPQIDIVDAKGNLVSPEWGRQDWGQGKDELRRYSHIFHETGDYYIRVRSGDTAGTGSYKFAVRERPSRDDGDATFSNFKNYLSEGDSAKGTLVMGDTDQYQAYLTKGRQYSFTLEADNSGAAGIERRPDIKVLDGLGNAINAKVSTANGKTTVTFTASQTDYAYFKFSNPTFLDGGDYKVSLSGKAAPAPKTVSLASLSPHVRADAAQAGAEASSPSPLRSVASGLGVRQSVSGLRRPDDRSLSGAAGLASS